MIWNPWARIRELERANAALEASRRSIIKSRDRLLDEYTSVSDSNLRIHSALAAKNARLSQIASMETPSCASIGKRMAAVARGG